MPLFEIDDWPGLGSDDILFSSMKDFTSKLLYLYPFRLALEMYNSVIDVIMNRSGAGKNTAEIQKQALLLYRLGLGCVLLIPALQLGYLTFFRGDERLGWVAYLFAPLASLLACLGLAYGGVVSRKRNLHAQIPAAFFLAGMFLALAGDCIASVYAFNGNLPALPGYISLVGLAFYPLFLLGLTSIPMGEGSIGDALRLGIDVLVIILATGLLYWAFQITPIVDTLLRRPEALSLVLAPLGDMTLAWAVMVVLFQPLRGDPDPATWLLLAVPGGMVWVNGYAVELLSRGALNSFHPINAASSFLTLLLMLCGLVQALVASSPTPIKLPLFIKRLANLVWRLRLLLPYTMLVASCYVLFTGLVGNDLLDARLIGFWVGAIILLVAIRQTWAIWENDMLSRQLNELNSQLETRVAQRTEELSLAYDDLRREMAGRLRIEQALREREQSLLHNALHDALTGLPNRAMLLDHLGQAIKRMRQNPKYNFAVFYWDFDGFKAINDSLGHQAGDLLLINISKRMQQMVRKSGLASRLGGDEFVLLIDNVSSHEAALTISENMLGQIKEPFLLEGQTIFLTASIGIVLGGNGYSDPLAILRDADLAMYHAKSMGRSRSALYTPEFGSEATHRLVLERDLRGALDRLELTMNYQPILNLQSKLIVGFEALLRWEHPERGFIPPRDFIPLLETAGMITEVTQWTLRQATSHLALWRQITDLDYLTVSVNISPRLFARPELDQMVERTLNECGLPGSALRLEITESAFIEDIDAASHQLQAWQAAGLQIYMDDFGTGYSSLSFLHKFPIDTIKIDRAFVQSLHRSEKRENSEIVHTILALAKELGKPVIAEGVETEEQLRILQDLGCQAVQGFFISPPLSPKQIPEWLATHGVFTVY